MNLRSTASQNEIESQCRSLSRQWHPDRYRVNPFISLVFPIREVYRFFFQNPEEKQKAQGIFLDIQQACDRLSHERKRRQKLHTLTS